jgi:methylmalonyl-CoA mutase N-terminal domain/subunit
VDSGERPIVGVNVGQHATPVPIATFAVPEALPRQRATLERLRATRDQATVAKSLRRLDECAAGGGNTMPVLIDLVDAGATLGECCQVFRNRHGGWQQPLR